MQPRMLDLLKARYNFAAWRRTSRGRERVFVRNYRITGNELPEPLIRARTARLSTARRVNTSTWGLPPSAVAERPLVMDIYEYPSSDGAQEALLELTAQFHRPIALDVRTSEVGDVSLATPDGAWFAFARGNLLVRITSGAGLTTVARSAAPRVDGALMSRPAAAAAAVRLEAPELDIFRAERLDRRGAVRLAVDGLAESFEAPDEEQPCVKVFSRGASVVVDDGLLVVPEEPDVEVDVFVETSIGHWTHRRYQSAPPEDTEPGTGQNSSAVNGG